MIANCDVLITRYSTTVYVGLALGKEAYSDFDMQELRRLTPIQNNAAAANIAAVCRQILEGDAPTDDTLPRAYRRSSLRFIRRHSSKSAKRFFSKTAS
jgi:hypothetical protein